MGRFYGGRARGRAPVSLPRMHLDRVRTSLRLRALDARDRVRGRSDRLVPPRRLDFVGPSDFVETGEEFARHLVEHAGLTPGSAVLDVGCGIGRMARPLTRILGPAGRYAGFDINPEGIAWCRRRYASHPNFRFALADLHNARYHPAGTQAAADYRFPHPDGSFDVVFMTSVATHLLADECAHYLAESARVLKPGGRLLVTFFWLDEISVGLIADGRAELAFPAVPGPVSVLDPEVPEEAVAYTEDWILGRLREHGLRLEAMHPGSWSGRDGHLSFQDVVVASRGAS